MAEIKYKVTDNGDMLTVCPHGIIKEDCADFEFNTAFVGGSRCSRCEYSREINRNNNFVICDHPESVEEESNGWEDVSRNILEKAVTEEKPEINWYEEFERRVKHWVEVFGLSQYSVSFSHYKINGDAQAQVALYEKYADAVFTLNENYVEDPDAWTTGIDSERVDVCAFHEVIHLLLSNFRDLAINRYASMDEMEKEEEKICRVMENIVYPRMKDE